MISRTTLLAAFLFASLAACKDDELPLAMDVDPGVDPPAPSPEPKDFAANEPPKDAIPADGPLSPHLAEVDDVVKKFMRATCTGAASVAIGFGGEPLLARGYGYKAGPPTEACAAADDPFVGGERIGSNTAFRIGSNSKAVTAAILRAVLRQKLEAEGKPATDSDIEGLLVFDPANDLVSRNVLTAVAGSGAGGPGGACVPGAISQVTASGQPDPRWASITVGHVLGHRTGLPRGGNPITSKLARIRSIGSESALAFETAKVDAPDEARNALAAQRSGGRFVRGVTLEEYLVGNADLCFAFAPGAAPAAGVDPYSNFAYGIAQHIAEHVSGLSLAAPLGQPDAHAGSLLGQFLATRVGIVKGASSSYGIYFSQPIEDARDLSEPRYRAWDGASQNGAFFDTKRPYCVWDAQNGTCDGSAFDSASARFSWSWTPDKVPVSYENEGFAPGVGLLAAEMPLYLKLMSKFWISGAGSTPFYGRERTGGGPTRWHIGELAGTHSTAAQFGGDAVPYMVVPRRPDGELDLSKWSGNLPETSCKLPAKLDLVLAVNQVNDASCVAAEGAICSLRYMALRDLVKEALCKVDWTKAAPQLW